MRGTRILASSPVMSSKVAAIFQYKTYKATHSHTEVGRWLPGAGRNAPRRRQERGQNDQDRNQVCRGEGHTIEAPITVRRGTLAASCQSSPGRAPSRGLAELLLLAALSSTAAVAQRVPQPVFTEL